MYHTIVEVDDLRKLQSKTRWRLSFRKGCCRERFAEMNRHYLPRDGADELRFASRLCVLPVEENGAGEWFATHPPGSERGDDRDGARATNGFTPPRFFL
jgi:hypothetical protein